ncbi:uncharacterized protein LOC114532360 [Dendronephthya gigantea]|uniref:uncharacterized protein LOC114532360 n=1 Tax=Dendronephthya gigantea TaxID=151771 RepID=UPI00106A146A|nr:uncharacterized protein LOC114532360 [Dendronephthya gigantea]
MFLKTSDNSFLHWKRKYTETPSNDTGPSFTYTRSVFDVDGEDYKPGSCEDIKSTGAGEVDGYYVIFPRGACGDSLEVWCSDMNTTTTSPKEYVDLNPASNYAIYAGLDQPCQQNNYPGKPGKTWFNKIRISPNSMTVDRQDFDYTEITGQPVQFGIGQACFHRIFTPSSCHHGGRFNINLKNTSVRVKPTVEWHGHGWWWLDPTFQYMINFKRSSDNREISANCGGYCGTCSPKGSLDLELASCVRKKPRSCADVKYYRDINLDGNYTIYPYATGLIPIRVFCAGMSTTEPKEYINVLHDSGKNFALRNLDHAYSHTCNIKPGSIAHEHWRGTDGHSTFSKIRLKINNMEVVRDDHSFGSTLFGKDIRYAHAYDAFSVALCEPRGMFNIDLTGTGLRIKPELTWTRSLYPSYHVAILTIREDFYRQIVDAKCGGYGGSCYPVGSSLYVEVVVPFDPAGIRYFGKTNLSFVDTSDKRNGARNLELSKACSEAVGMEDGRIPDSSFSASSFSTGRKASEARLARTQGNWRAKNGDLEPWVQVDLLFIRLVTGVATHGTTNNYLKTYFLSFGFDADQLMVYLDDSKQRKIFARDDGTAGHAVVKEILSKPFFARHVRFTVLTWANQARLAAEIYVCPRATLHHVITTADFHYLESSYPRVKGDRGELVTRIMPPVYTCSKFLYHMIGSDMGRLDVYIKEVDKERQFLWTAVGEQSPHTWKKAVIPLKVDTAFKIIFVGIIGGGYKSDIAIGDVSLTNDINCTFAPSQAVPGPSCSTPCVGRSKCDNVTGKCLCFDDEFLDEKCESEFLETIYKDALHYWSFDDPDNVVDHKTGARSNMTQKPTTHLTGPVNLALLTLPEDHSGLQLGSIHYSCLKDPSFCPTGFSISLWVKPGDIRNREHYFTTNLGDRSGVSLVSYADNPGLNAHVRGEKHKCNLIYDVYPRHWTWLFISITWKTQADGTGKLLFYIIEDTGMTRKEKICPEIVHSLSASQNIIETELFQYNSGRTFAIDELAVWNKTLTEEKIMEIYHLVARNPSNTISWIFQLDFWSRPLLDLEDPEHETAMTSFNSLIEKYIENASVKKMWDKLTTDRCVYVGNVRNGVATWREDVVFHCNDSFGFQPESEHFNLKLDVKNVEISINLNNVHFGSFPAEGSNTARGGFFETNQDDSNDVLVKDFYLDTNQDASEFTFHDCDMSNSGATENAGEYRLRGTQTASPTGHCMAFYEKPVLSPRYKIEAKFRHDFGDPCYASECSHMGFLVKYEDNNNYVIFFVRLVYRCFELWHCEAGVTRIVTSGDCDGGFGKKGIWQTLAVHVDLTNIKAYKDGSLLLNENIAYNPQPSKVGAVVWYNQRISASFKDFELEEYFTPISIFPTIHEFQLPLIKDVVSRHKMAAVFGNQVTTDLNYTVSATFLNATGSGAAFGLCYNIKNATNFDFVYYRRDRKLFAEVAQSVRNTSWLQNEISRTEIENSSLVLTSISSRKVPTHVPFNVSSFALNSTALNLSWHWSPDSTATGVFVGFKMLYRSEIDTPESWAEKVIYGREFENNSWVVLDGLRKGMEYSFKVVAFSLVGDGWPSEEVVISTLDDFPDIVDLNVSVSNVDLRSVFIQWSLLPKYNWNGLAKSYVITLLDIVDGVNHTIQKPSNTSNVTYTSLKHFTNYSVSLMALNNVGYSSPIQGPVFQTLEHVPSSYPFNLSLTVLNTSALTVSWKPINEDLWHGMPLGYVIFCNNSNEERNFTVTLSNLEFTVTNLTAFTFYDLAVAGYTRKGLGPRHPTLTVRLPEEVPRIAPVNLRASGCRASNTTTPFPAFCLITLEWDPVPAEKVRGIIRGYLTTYKPMDITYIKPGHPSLPDLMELVTQNTSSTSFQFKSLFHTNYSMQVLAYTTGNGVRSSTFYFMTPEGVPSRRPLNLTVTAPNTTALTVSWHPIDDDISWHGVPLGYVIFCNHSNEERNFTVTSSNSEFTVTNLTAFTFYDVTVAGYTRKGLGPRHPTVRMSTREEVPRVAPVNLRILNQTLPPIDAISTNNNTTPSIPTSYTVSLKWSPVPADQVRGIIRGYTVTYEPIEVRFITRARRSLAGHLNAVTVNTTSANIVLDNLLFYTNYSVQVQAYTTDNGVPSSVLHFMTPEGVPAVGPGNLYANNDGSKYKLSVKWDSIPIDRRNGILLGYHVYYQTSSSSANTKNKTTVATDVILTGLEIYTSYDIRVCGYTVVGDGVCSKVTARTRSRNLAPYTPPWNATTITSADSISLLWKPFPDALWFDHPRGYHITFQRVEFGGIRTSGDDVMIVRVDEKTERYTWTNLVYYTKYKIEISPITYLGYGPKVTLYGETCQCPSLATTTFQMLPPYVMRTADGKLSGIVPELVRRMTSSCCVTCGGTVLNFNEDGFGEVSEKENYPELLKSFHQTTTFAFPIMGHVDRTSYGSRFGFVSGIETPGMLVVVKRQLAENLALGVLRSVFGIWPILLINVLLALAAGIIMWMLDSSSNEDIFPRTCIRGSLTGFWWAFVSMTTVGYGDTTAKSVASRIFAVIWILTGLCLYSILIGDLSSALSSTVSVSETMLYGAKVAALINSTEEMVAIRRNAKVVGGPYFSLVEIQKALIEGKVDAAIIDIYAAGLTKELWNHTELRMSRVLDYSSSYGIVTAGGMEGIQRCFRSYVRNNRIKTMELVLQYTTTLKGVKTEETTEYVQDLIDGQSATFRKTLFVLCVGFGVVFMLGMIWNFTCRKRRSTRVKKDNSVHPETIPADEIFKDIKTSYQKLRDRLQATKKRHRQQILNLAKTSTNVS